MAEDEEPLRDQDHTKSSTAQVINADVSNLDALSPSGDDSDAKTIGDLASSTELAPPLPPRPSVTKAGSVRLSSRPLATTALSLADVHTQTNVDGKGVGSVPGSRSVSRKSSYSRFGRLLGGGSELDDSASIRSLVPTLNIPQDGESTLGEALTGDSDLTPSASMVLDESEEPFELVTPEIDKLGERIEREFDDVQLAQPVNSSDDTALLAWKAKLKHFIIISASGKPIYSRHGGDQMISHYVGVAQTLVSLYQGSKDPLRGFTSGSTRFTMLSKGPLNLLAISRLGESDAQLRTQLESLYMQILSTLTLPAMERMFSNRPSTDLRRPLQGTEVLLDGLADGFTRGSPSTLLSSLECLRIRKTHRRVINDTLLKARSPNLLYGLIVAAGRLVSVVRPKKHSLHPGDLHLIFNMLFEAGSVKTGGGENWIPLCLPGFNNTGFLYMYVSFFTTGERDSATVHERPSSAARKEDDLAIVLISANKEAFFELRKMRDDLIVQLGSNGSMAIIKTAIHRGHATCSDIVPGTVIRHFLYKSRGNVQFVMPSFEPHFEGLVARRRLMTLYHQLHDCVHSRNAHLKVQHCVAVDSTALAWETPLFELYCVAGPQATRAALSQGANRIVQWIRREEERVFIIGGAVF